MEPRHQERAADELTAERVEEATEGSSEPRGDDIRPKDDDTRHDASADEESQI